MAALAFDLASVHIRGESAHTNLPLSHFAAELRGEAKVGAACSTAGWVHALYAVLPQACLLISWVPLPAASRGHYVSAPPLSAAVL